jgi:hypothetical protein
MDGAIGGALLTAETRPIRPTPDLREERQVVALLRKRIANDRKTHKRRVAPAR